MAEIRSSGAHVASSTRGRDRRGLHACSLSFLVLAAGALLAAVPGSAAAQGRTRASAVTVPTPAGAALAAPARPAQDSPAEPARASETPYFEFQVEKPVAPAARNPAPHYPDLLKSSNVGGGVLAQFVVDTTGRAEMGTFKVLTSSDELFTASVKEVLPRWRFVPAETGGRKVKQLVQLPFTFALRK